LEKAQARADEIVKRRASSARLEKRKRILTEKDMIVGEVYAEVREKILALPDDEYLDLLKNLVVSHSVGGDEKVMLAKNDLVRFKARLPRWVEDITKESRRLGKTTTVEVSSETRDIEGGLILVRGRMEINLGLDVIIAETKYRLEGDVAQILFGA
jgi:V/A-type H+/Na+-transporting ATPase subunit E